MVSVLPASWSPWNLVVPETHFTTPGLPRYVRWKFPLLASASFNWFWSFAMKSLSWYGRITTNAVPFYLFHLTDIH